MSKLLHSDQQLLHDWAQDLLTMFNDNMPYQVGSTLEASTTTPRDVDVRILLSPKEYKQLSQIVNVERLSLAVSLWGQKVTGLPIDFQVQDAEYANLKHGGVRSAIGIKSKSLKGDGTP